MTNRAAAWMRPTFARSSAAAFFRSLWSDLSVTGVYGLRVPPRLFRDPTLLAAATERSKGKNDRDDVTYGGS